MDIARPDLKKQKIRRQILWAAVGVVLLAGITVFVMRLKPAAPTVDRSTVWTDTVKRGVGMALVVRAERTDDALAALAGAGQPSTVIGRVAPRAPGHPGVVIS